jgi:poly-beta-hydroxybutyrate-responsive repressor
MPAAKKNPGASESEEAPRQPRLHGDLLATSLLGLLRDWNAHGYQLAQRLADAGLPPFDVGTIYRTLRQLEKAGLVSSLWDTSESGPAKRTYSLTAAGELFLGNWTDILKKYQSLFQWPQPSPPNSRRSDAPPPGDKP